MWEGKAAQLSSVAFAGDIWKGGKNQVFIEVDVNNRHINTLLLQRKSIQTISTAEDVAGQSQGGRLDRDIYFAVVKQVVWVYWHKMKFIARFTSVAMLFDCISQRK